MKRTIVIVMTLLLALQVNALSFDLEPSCQMMEEMNHDDMDHHMMSDMEHNSEPMPEDCCGGACECDLTLSTSVATLLNNSTAGIRTSSDVATIKMFALIEVSLLNSTPPPISA